MSEEEEADKSKATASNRKDNDEKARKAEENVHLTVTHRILEY